MSLLDRLLSSLNPASAPDIFNSIWDEFLDLLRPHVRNELVKRYVNFDDLGKSILETNTYDVSLPTFLNQTKGLRAIWTQKESKVTQEGLSILLTNYYRALGKYLSVDSLSDFVADQIKTTTPEERTNQVSFLFDVAMRRAGARVFRRIIS